MALATDPGRRRPRLSDLRSHVTCVICAGYFIDATTIVECLHTFCRSCILRHLSASSYCPVCDVMIHRTKGASSLRSDRILQTMVYKMVPGLFREEMKQRREFYRSKPYADPELPSWAKGDVEAFVPHVFTASEQVDIRLAPFDADRFPANGLDERGADPSKSDGDGPPVSEGDGPPVKYLRCTASTPVAVLQKFIRTKFQIPPAVQVQLIHDSHVLPDDISLLDLGYIYNSTQISPVSLWYRFSRRLKRPAAHRELDTRDQPPAKCARVAEEAPDDIQPKSEDGRTDEPELQTGVEACKPSLTTREAQRSKDEDIGGIIETEGTKVEICVRNQIQGERAEDATKPRKDETEMDKKQPSSGGKRADECELKMGAQKADTIQQWRDEETEIENKSRMNKETGESAVSRNEEAADESGAVKDDEEADEGQRIREEVAQDGAPAKKEQEEASEAQPTKNGEKAGETQLITEEKVRKKSVLDANGGMEYKTATKTNVETAHGAARKDDTTPKIVPPTANNEWQALDKTRMYSRDAWLTKSAGIVKKPLVLLERMFDPDDDDPTSPQVVEDIIASLDAAEDAPDGATSEHPEAVAVRNGAVRSGAGSAQPLQTDACSAGPVATTAAAAHRPATDGAVAVGRTGRKTREPCRVATGGAVAVDHTSHGTREAHPATPMAGYTNPVGLTPGSTSSGTTGSKPVVKEHAQHDGNVKTNMNDTRILNGPTNANEGATIAKCAAKNKSRVYAGNTKEAIGSPPDLKKDPGIAPRSAKIPTEGACVVAKGVQQPHPTFTKLASRRPHGSGSGGLAGVVHIHKLSQNAHVARDPASACGNEPSTMESESVPVSGVPVRRKYSSTPTRDTTASDKNLCKPDGEMALLVNGGGSRREGLLGASNESVRDARVAFEPIRAISVDSEPVRGGRVASERDGNSEDGEHLHGITAGSDATTRVTSTNTDTVMRGVHTTTDSPARRNSTTTQPVLSAISTTAEPVRGIRAFGDASLPGAREGEVVIERVPNVFVHGESAKNGGRAWPVTPITSAGNVGSTRALSTPPHASPTVDSSVQTVTDKARASGSAPGTRRCSVSPRMVDTATDTSPRKSPAPVSSNGSSQTASSWRLASGQSYPRSVPTTVAGSGQTSSHKAHRDTVHRLGPESPDPAHRGKETGSRLVSPDPAHRDKETGSSLVSPDPAHRDKETGSGLVSPDPAHRDKETGSSLVSPDPAHRGKETGSRLVSPDPAHRGKETGSRLVSPDPAHRGKETGSKLVSPDPAHRGKETGSRLMSPDPAHRGAEKRLTPTDAPRHGTEKRRMSADTSHHAVEKSLQMMPADAFHHRMQFIDSTCASKLAPSAAKYPASLLKIPTVPNSKYLLSACSEPATKSAGKVKMVNSTKDLQKRRNSSYSVWKSWQNLKTPPGTPLSADGRTTPSRNPTGMSTSALPLDLSTHVRKTAAADSTSMLATTPSPPPKSKNAQSRSGKAQGTQTIHSIVSNLASRQHISLTPIDTRPRSSSKKTERSQRVQTPRPPAPAPHLTPPMHLSMPEHALIAGGFFCPPPHINTGLANHIGYDMAMRNLLTLSHMAMAQGGMIRSPMFPMQPHMFPARPRSHDLHRIPDPSLLRQQSEVRLGTSSKKASPVAGSTAPQMTSPTELTSASGHRAEDLKVSASIQHMEDLMRTSAAIQHTEDLMRTSAAIQQMEGLTKPLRKRSADGHSVSVTAVP